jgi:hypothetical protein
VRPARKDPGVFAKDVGRISPTPAGVADPRTDSQQEEEKHGPNQDISASRPVEALRIPLEHPGVKQSLGRSLVEQRIGDSKQELGAEAERIGDRTR